MTQRQSLFIGAISMAICVAIGAFGAHGLKPILLANNNLETFKTGVEYFFYNSLGILLISQYAEKNKFTKYSILLLVIGNIIFPFSLFILCITDIKILGAITPIGGLTYIIGWLLFGVGILKQKNK